MTNRRRAGTSLLAAILVLWTCLSRLAAATPVAIPAGADEMTARIHWQGLQSISANTNAGDFMKVWRLPQTQALLAQTLDKLSRLPGHRATNAAAALLRPLLDDVITSECYLEFCSPTNYPSSIIHHPFLLALHLPPARARLWQTNLAAALADWTGRQPVPTSQGWLLPAAGASGRVELCRQGRWTLIGLGLDGDLRQSDFATRLAPPAVSVTSNLWLQADFHLQPSTLSDLFSLVFGCDPNNSSLITHHSSLSAVYLTLSGEHGTVVTHGTLDFSHRLDLQLAPWDLPTNLIHVPLSGFTVLRGFPGWLAGLPAWQKLQLAPPPDQICFWAHNGGPFESYFVMPLPAAGRQLHQLAVRLVQNGNPWLANHAQGNLAWQTNPPVLVWNGALILSPYLKPVEFNRHDGLLGGLYPLNVNDPNPSPTDPIHTVLNTSGLIYYQVEDTGVRVDADLFIYQLFRVVFQKAQLSAGASATVWLKKIEPLLGVSTTSLVQSSPKQLVLIRHSTIGLTALELHLLADWLESPQFPRGLHTFLAPPDKN